MKAILRRFQPPTLFDINLVKGFSNEDILLGVIVPYHNTIDRANVARKHPEAPEYDPLFNPLTFFQVNEILCSCLHSVENITFSVVPILYPQMSMSQVTNTLWRPIDPFFAVGHVDKWYIGSDDPAILREVGKRFGDGRVEVVNVEEQGIYQPYEYIQNMVSKGLDLKYLPLEVAAYIKKFGLQASFTASSQNAGAQATLVEHFTRTQRSVEVLKMKNLINSRRQEAEELRDKFADERDPLKRTQLGNRISKAEQDLSRLQSELSRMMDRR